MMADAGGLAARLARRAARLAVFAPLRRRVVDAVRRRIVIDETYLPGLSDPGFDPARFVIKETAYGFRLWVSLEERAISRPILIDTYEIPETRLMQRLVRPGDTVVDIGANIGYHTLHLARLVGPGGTVHAFEPMPYLVDILTRSLRENAPADVRLHAVALDERSGSALMRHAPRTTNFGGAHLAPATAVPADHADDAAVTQRLDDVLGDARPTFVKIDVEGAEPRVLRGAERILGTARPLILSELHNVQLRLVSGVSADDFLDQMLAAGYGAQAIGETGEPAGDIRRYPGDAPLNVLFSPFAR